MRVEGVFYLRVILARHLFARHAHLPPLLRATARYKSEYGAIFVSLPRRVRTLYRMNE